MSNFSYQFQKFHEHDRSYQVSSYSNVQNPVLSKKNESGISFSWRFTPVVQPLFGNDGMGGQFRVLEGGDENFGWKNNSRSWKDGMRIFVFKFQ